MAPPEQARTRLARAAVIDAARELFLDRGYGATTVDAISERAGVPEPTVYRLYSSKLGILKSLLDVAIAGDAAKVPMPERPAVRAFAEAPGARDRMAGFASVVASVNRRVGTLYRVLVGASGTDPGAAALLEELTKQRRDGQRILTRSLARSGALRPDIKERAAADVVHALASPEVYHLLVVDRSWSPDRYERWLAEVLTDQLLPPSSGR